MLSPQSSVPLAAIVASRVGLCSGLAVLLLPCLVFGVSLCFVFRR